MELPCWCYIPPLYTILVPSATRLKMSLMSSSGRTKKFEFFHWLTKNECAAEMNITELYAFHFTSGPVDSSLARFTHNKLMFPIDPKES